MFGIKNYQINLINEGLLEGKINLFTMFSVLKMYIIVGIKFLKINIINEGLIEGKNNLFSMFSVLNIYLIVIKKIINKPNK